MPSGTKQLAWDGGSLPPRLVDDLRAQNPWWENKSLPPLPAFKRWPFKLLLARILREPPLAKINVVRGPRQIGKTTLQYQIIEHLLENGVNPARILRVQFDELPSFRSLQSGEPIVEIIEWYSAAIGERDLNAAARQGRPALLFLDEVQNLTDWDVQLKSLVDRLDIRLLVTGSSALRIEMGRDSLAGRIQTLEVGPFRLNEIAEVRGLGTLPRFSEPNGTGQWSRLDFWTDLREHGKKQGELLAKTFVAFSERGGYPLAQRADLDWAEVARQLNETVIRRVIQHDLRVGERGRKRDPQLLEEVFRMAARYCGQSPNPSTLANEARDALNANVGTNRIRAYIDFLDNSLLIRAIPPHEMRLKRRRGGPKFCLSDHALRAAWLDEVVPLDPAGLRRAPTLQDLAGRLAESVVGYYFSSLGLPLAHLPAREKDVQEIDFIMTVGDHRVPIEVKYQQRIDPVRDTLTLQKFLARPVNRANVAVLVTRNDMELRLPNNIVQVPLSTLLLAN